MINLSTQISQTKPFLINILILLGCGLVIAINNIIGHYYPPNSIFFTPLVIPICTGLVLVADFKIIFHG